MLFSVVLQKLSVPVGSSSLLLDGLTPGATYRLVATSVSGGVESKSTSLDRQTGESCHV